MKHLSLLISVVISILSSAHAQENNLSNGNRNSSYIGMNPVSFFAALQLQDDIKRYIPEVSGLEYGFSLAGGYFMRSKQSVEARFSVGNMHQVARVSQLHLGTNYFMFKNSPKRFSDFYIGGFLKFWDYYNRLTRIHFYNIAPYVAVGYLFEINPLLLDVRINQTVAVYSWSSLKHSSAGRDWFFSPWPKFIPVMPSLTVTIGWKF